MLGRRKNLKQYILYLNITIDNRLIEHLAPFVEQKRGNEEIRRLIYAGLDCNTRTNPGEQPRSSFTPTPEPSTESMTESLPGGRRLIADVRQKAKKIFG